MYTHTPHPHPNLRFRQEFLELEWAVVGPLAYLLAGCAAATPAAFIATPADVVKTRQQQGCGLLIVEEGCDVCDLDAAAAGTQPVTDVAASVYREGGLAAFFAGGFERAVQHGPQMAVTLAAFDVGMRACREAGWC